MKPLSPVRLLIFAALLEVLGVLLPALMVAHVLPSTVLWNVTAFLSGVTGLFIGIVVMQRYFRRK